MRRLLAITALLLGAGTIAVIGPAADDGGGDYKVRAIFDSAVSVIPGEDVKISGVKVGKVDSLDVTKDQKAAITLAITVPGYADFREDATCTIRPQSLIGEKFVECTPTEPRAVGEAPKPALREIKEGPGKGSHLLPITQTSTPVDIDLINNILRKPYAERLSLIIGELGIGVAGRGKDINDAIRRANPALQETDKVLKILADQNTTLADLARDSDTVLAPLARERSRVADSIVQSGTVAQATAERSAELEAGLQRLPGFLRELRPTMVRLGALSDQAAPVFEDLGAQAPAINRVIRQLGPFSAAALPALRTLGQATDIGGPALVRSRPTIRALRTLAITARPLASNLAQTLDSFQKTGGVERVMDYIFFQVAAINGFDSVGHYLRAALILNTCSSFSVTPIPGCSSNFAAPEAAAAKLSAADQRGLVERLAALAGTDATDTGARDSKAIQMPKIQLPGKLGDALGGTPAGSVATQGGRKATAPQAPAAAPSRNDSTAALFDYLLGSEK